ncbi:tipc, putative [Entamoeba invadens IP1]|uniref:Tipc, putative n=1 Tax=Entamoeba invadens IP1 TaxID=370355 RepID=A0A0A1U6X5_ENTIV|nr:tipc, putative [Entamoeba invadens IP1]ELP90075.1 tipc, putative [Entamoeba invadens IP1]|eukprot:XP_004256846.1 tipc, putative [Entamoeba invadens IP1]
MFESIISEILTTVLGKYIVLNPQMLKINLGKGEVILSNLSLRKDALKSLNLPIDIVHGQVARLHVKIKNLSEIVIQVANVTALCVPQKQFVYDAKKEMEEDLKKKLEAIEQFEAFTKITSGDSGFTAKIVRNVLEGLIVTVSNVHLRYEDNDENTGIYFSNLTFCNAKEQPVGIIRKEAVVESLMFYAGTEKMEINEKPTKINNITEMPELTVTIDFVQKHYKQIKVYVQANMFKSTLTHKQYQVFLSVVGRLSEYAQAIKFLGLRPQVPVVGNEKRWWMYAVDALKKKKQDDDNKKVREDVIRNYENSYTALYSKWKDSGKDDTPKEILAMDKELRTDEIIELRKRGLAKLASGMKTGWYHRKKMGMTKEEVETLCRMLEANDVKIEDKEEMFRLEIHLEYGEVSLENNDRSRTLARLITNNIDLKCVIYGKGFQIQFVCDNAEVMEFISCHEKVLKRNMDGVPLVHVIIEHPIKGPDAIITAKVAGTEVSFNKALLMGMYQFFVVPDKINISQIRAFAEQQLGKFYQLATNRIGEIITNHQPTIQLNVEIVAPTVTVPLFFDNKESPCFRVSLGNLRIDSVDAAVGQSFKVKLKDVDASVFGSMKNSTQLFYANYVLQNFSGEANVNVGIPDLPFVDITAVFKPFVCKVSKAKIDLVKEYISEFSTGWDKVIIGKKIEGELSLDDLAFIKQQKELITNLMKKAAKESFRVNAVLEKFELGVAQIGDSEERHMITQLIVEKVGLKVGVKMNGADVTATVGSVELEDHVNQTPKIPYIISSKYDGNTTCCEVKMNVLWNLGLIDIKGTTQVNKVGVVVQPKVVSELIKYGMSLLFSYNIDLRSKQEKEESLKKVLKVMKDAVGILDEDDDISFEEKPVVVKEKKTSEVKEESTTETQNNKKTKEHHKNRFQKELEAFELKVHVNMEMSVVECGLCLVEDNDKMATMSKLQNMRVGIQFIDKPEFSVEVGKANIFEIDEGSGDKRPVLVYNGDKLLQMNYKQSVLTVNEQQLPQHDITLNVDTLYFYLCPSFITRTIRIIASNSLIQAIDIEDVHKQLVKGFSSLSTNLKSAMKSITIKKRVSNGEISLFNPKIVFNSPQIRLFKDYASGDYSLNASAGVIHISSDITQEENTIRQMFMIQTDNIDISTTRMSQTIPVIRELSFECQACVETQIEEKTSPRVTIVCVVDNPLKVDLEATQLQFCVDYILSIKDKVDLKMFENLIDHIKSTRQKRAAKSVEYTKDLRRSTRKEKVYTLTGNFSVKTIEILFKNENNLALAGVTNVNVAIRMTEDMYLEGEINVFDVKVEDARPKAEGRFHKCFYKRSDSSFATMKFDMFIPTQQLISESVINCPSIVIIPSLFADLAMIVMKLIPQKPQIESEAQKKDKKECDSTVIKKITSSIQVKEAIEAMTRCEVKDSVLQDDADLKRHSGSKIFNNLREKYPKLSDHAIEYLCDEMLRQSFICGSFPFNSNEMYTVLTADVDNQTSIFMPSFEPNKLKPEFKKNDEDRMVFIVAINNLSCVIMMDDDDLNTAYLLSEVNGSGNFSVKKSSAMNFVCMLNQVVFKNCKAEQGLLKYEGNVMNDGFDFSIRGTLEQNSSLLDFSSQCIFTPGKFVVSFDDIRMFRGGVKTLQKLIKRFNDLNTGKPKLIANQKTTLATLFRNPPNIRIDGKDFYIHSTFSINDFEVVMNHPTILTPVYRMNVVKAEMKVSGFNDDISVNISPMVSFDAFNQKFGEYERVVEQVQMTLTLRMSCDIVEGEPRMCLGVNCGFGDPVDVTVTKEFIDQSIHMYKQIDKLLEEATGSTLFKEVRVVDHLTTVTTRNKIWVSIDGREKEILEANKETRLGVDTFGKEIKEFYLVVNGESFIVPLTTTMTQLYILKNRVYFMSHLVYCEDGSKTVFLESCKQLKNVLDIPITICLRKDDGTQHQLVLNPDEKRSLPQEFVKCPIQVQFEDKHMTFMSDNITKTVLCPIDKSKNDFLLIEPKSVTFETPTGNCEEMNYLIKYPFMISNMLPRVVNVSIEKNSMVVESGKTVRIVRRPSDNFLFEGEGTSIKIKMRKFDDVTIDYYKLTNGMYIRARWDKGLCVIDSEFLLFNKTNENIFAEVGRSKVLIQPNSSGSIMTFQKDNLKLVMCEGYSQELQPKSITSGDLCIIGKKETNFVHLELSSDPKLEGVKIVTITYAYYVINVTDVDLIVKCGDQGDYRKVRKCSGDDNTPVPLILPKTKSTDVVPSFEIGRSDKGPWSKPICCVTGSATAFCLVKGNNMFERDSFYVTVRNYGSGQCVVIEHQSAHKCKYRLVNDTKHEIVYADVAGRFGFKNTIEPFTETSIEFPNTVDIQKVYVTSNFLPEQEMKFSLKKLKFYDPFTTDALYFGYTYIINGITTLTFTTNQVKVMEECPLFILNNREQNGKSSITSSLHVPIVTFSFRAPSVGVDLVDHHRDELCYTRFLSVNANARINSKYSEAACDVGSIQVDCDTINADDEVLVYIPKTTLPAFHVSTQVIQSETSDTFFFFPFINVLVQPITVAVESSFIARLYDLFKSIPFHLFSTTTPETPKGIPPLNSKFSAFIKSLVLQPIVLSISLNLQPNQLVFIPYNAATALLHALGSSLVNIRDSSIKLNASIAKNINGDMASLKQVFIEHYYKQIMNQAILLFANSSFLGNPRGLLKDISTGCHDFFYEPAQGLTVSASSFGHGMAKGVRSLAKNTTHGAASSVSGMSKSFSSFVASLSFDQAYIDKRNADRRAKTTGEGMRKGFESFSSGMFNGVAGLVYQPVVGAQKDGVGGFFAGVGKGVVGVFVKPVVGAIDLVGKTSEGIGSSTNTNKILRIREPRSVNYKVVMKSYDKNESFLLKLVRNTKLDVYIVSYLSQGTCAWVLGEKHFYVYENNDIKIFKYPSLEINRTVDGLQVVCKAVKYTHSLRVKVDIPSSIAFLKRAQNVIKFN